MVIWSDPEPPQALAHYRILTMAGFAPLIRYVWFVLLGYGFGKLFTSN